MTAKALDIEHSVNGVTVNQHLADGFINGTAMCRAYGKNITLWLHRSSVQKMIASIAEDLGVTYSSLVVEVITTTTKDSSRSNRDVWIHPSLAFYLAEWCDPDFALRVSEWIKDFPTEKNQEKNSEADQEKGWQGYLAFKKKHYEVLRRLANS
jgi:hypothetical protein